MTKPCAFGLGIGLGALVSPLAQLFAARVLGRHWLETKE